MIRTFEVNSDAINPNNIDYASLYDTRETICSEICNSTKECYDVTILVQAYNYLSKTKECIQSIIENTADVNYNILLIDNGSTDETLEYFESLDFENKIILHISKNIGSTIPWYFVQNNWISKYLVWVNSDIIVTPHWLTNLLTVAKSDKKIGMVNPVSSNASNFQEVELEFSTYEEMQKKAEIYNVSNPAKWHERLRLITLGTLFTKECLMAIGLPLTDIGFIHDFGDDDVTFKVRRAGYKAILAKDTWIHHNHDFRHLERKTPEGANKSISIGRQNFFDKYHGIDAWGDVNNFINQYTNVLREVISKNPRILGIDTKCGTPILEIKNAIRSFGQMTADCYAFTTDAKYFLDLQTFCGIENVVCSSIENLSNSFDYAAFDYIVIGNNINTYPNPFLVISSAYKMLKKGGQIFFSLKNAQDAFTLLNALGYTTIFPSDYCYNFTPESFINKLVALGYESSFIGPTIYSTDLMSDDTYKSIEKMIAPIAPNNLNDTMSRLMTSTYNFVINS